MPIRYPNTDRSTKVLRACAKAEKDGTIADPKVHARIFGTKKQRMASAKRVERAVARFVKNEERYAKKCRRVNSGVY